MTKILNKKSSETNKQQQQKKPKNKKAKRKKPCAQGTSKLKAKYIERLKKIMAEETTEKINTAKKPKNYENPIKKQW